MKSLLEQYQVFVKEKGFSVEEGQIRLLEKLDSLRTRLLAPVSSSFFQRFQAFFKKRAVLKGLYIYGSVGRGKTTLMDCFYASIPYSQKRRLHFHEFMLEVHRRIATARREDTGGTGSHFLEKVAKDLAKQWKLLCFDEFFVQDIGDASILKRFFQCLWEQGVVVVATSNVSPDALYQGGLNRDLFLPFLEIFPTYMEVFCLEIGQDFRTGKEENLRSWYHPLNEAVRKKVQQAWEEKINSQQASSRSLLLESGRRLEVPCQVEGVARFHFSDLCQKSMGSADYLALTREYSTIFLEEIPFLFPEHRVAASRLISLVDIFYDARILLIASAAGTPEEICLQGLEEEKLPAGLLRTLSRLTQMSKESYLHAWKEIQKRKASLQC